jgi:hypothetical protein
MSEETKKKIEDLKYRINLGSCNTEQLAAWLFELLEILSGDQHE